MNEIAQLRERHDGKLPAFAWPGGYPILYGDRQGRNLCADCANEEVDESQAVTDCDVHWEGPSIECDECGHQIESAYGDPDAETAEEG